MVAEGTWTVFVGRAAREGPARAGASDGHFRASEDSDSRPLGFSLNPHGVASVASSRPSPESAAKVRVHDRFTDRAYVMMPRRDNSCRSAVAHREPWHPPGVMLRRPAHHSPPFVHKISWWSSTAPSHLSLIVIVFRPATMWLAPWRRLCLVWLRTLSVYRWPLHPVGHVHSKAALPINCLPKADLPTLPISIDHSPLSRTCV